MTSPHPLDNPVWAALTTEHRSVARVHGSAHAYRDDIAPFMAVETLDAQAWADLAQLDDTARMIRASIGELPPGAHAPFRAGVRQMVAPVVGTDLAATMADLGATPEYRLRELHDDDVPAMLDLTHRAKPGPFRPRTIELGGYLGVFENGSLVCMAGRRMRTHGWCEISAVCTDAAHLGRGLARRVTLLVAAGIQAEGRDAFLHVSDENPRAGALYEHLGFTVRAHLEVAAVVFPAAD